ncbi:MAG: glycosyltransferase family A protein [Balneolales bacterium]
MKFAVITPAYNEENYIKHTLESVAKQSLKPSSWIIVDDGSTDSTFELISEYAQDFSWIQAEKKPIKFNHQAGAGVVQTFNYGLERLPFSNYDVIVKLDADLTLPEDYFDRVAEEYRKDPKLGMCGGVCVVEENGEYVFESVADPDHLRGPIKSYRKACFEQIGQIRPIYGWDTLDELLALYYGWNIKVLQDLKVVHHRKTHSETKSLQILLQSGRAFHTMGYGPFVALFSALKQIKLPPAGLSSIVIYWGYLSAWFSFSEQAVSHDEAKFIRRYRYKRAFSKLTHAIGLGNKVMVNNN